MNVRMQSALDSLTVLFFADASTSRSDLMVTAWQEIQTSSTSSGSDPETSFTTKKRLFRSGLDAWLESLAALTERYAQQLQEIVGGHPELVGTNTDPPQWLRSQLERLLEKKLGHKLFAEALADPQGTPGPTGKKSPYLTWFWNVCDGVPDFDAFPGSGRPEPWCAPAWCWGELTFKGWVRKGRPERLDVDRTEKLVRSAQRRFVMRLSYVLDQIEHKVRVAMASSGKLPVIGSGFASSDATQVAAAGVSPKLPKTAISGEIASQYNEELHKMQQASRGRSVSEDRLRKHFPDFTIWGAIDESQTLSPKAKREYFSGSLDGRTYQHRFHFIAEIMGAGDFSTVYRWYKQYRDSAKLKRSRRRTSNSNSSKQSVRTT